MKHHKQANDWAPKVLALIKGGNLDAALAQIKVAPTVKDLQQLQKALAAAGLLERSRQLREALEANLAALSAPRLHRSP
jgi:hypothetical protein